MLAGYFSNIYISPAKAQTQTPPTNKYLTGYAWSDNIGWISFATSTNGNNLVTVDTNGNMSGYAWSDNIGWIKFGGLSGFPTSTVTTASNAVYNSSGAITGWARAYSPILDTQTVTVSVPNVSTTTVIVPSHYNQTGTTTTTETFSVDGCGPSCQTSNWDSWVAPTGVASVTAEVWGPGGDESEWCNEWNDNRGAGGGGGYSKGVYSVTPGTSYDVFVSGWSGNGSSLFGPNGSVTYYGSTHLFLEAFNGDDGQCGAYNQDIEIGGAGGVASGGTISNLTGQSAYKTTAGASAMPAAQLYGHGADSTNYSNYSGSGQGFGYPGFVKLTYDKPIYTFVATSTTIATTTTYSTTTSQINSNGWDGWISLSGDGYGITNGGSNLFSGYAWGSDVLGWLDFSQVSINDVNTTGSCGSSNGQTVSSTPNTNLCSVGQPSTVSTSPDYLTYAWQCTGTNGVNVLCYANRTCGSGKQISYVDGSCVNSGGTVPADCSTPAYTLVNGQCLNSNTICALDGVKLANNGTSTFYKSRVSNNCTVVDMSATRTCTAGTLDSANSVYKYKKCVSPTYKEF